MIRINLLPHREMRRERRRRDFIALLGLVLLAGVVAAGIVALGINARIESQQARNEFIHRENAKLDEQIREIAQLRQELEALKARQGAVENLQRDRTLPVHVMDELVRHTPEGVYYKLMRQDDRRVSLVGLAQSNEKVSGLLRALANDTRWLEKPELLEVKSTILGKADTRDARRVFEFSLVAAVRAPVVDAVAGK